ncbi:GntR family transcriptional regulator [Lacticaseibacillus jixiensis]|uniref:GntR family transcriptional regulator n=1 Tax=Lacticaseibacillus jixiensis TaxID=3231926 RepID=UPI0036F1A5C4
MVVLANFQEEAYQALLTKILRLELKPGERINKKDLEAELHIGATPVREAILRLRREDMVQVFPQSGTFIAKINIDTVYQARFVRENIEQVIMQEAALKLSEAQLVEAHKLLDLQHLYLDSHDYDQFFDLDDAFHHLFYTAVNKEFIWQWLQSVTLGFNRFRYLRLEIADLNWDQIYADHVAIVDAVVAKDNARLSDLLAQHLHMVDSDALVLMKAHPDYFA